MKRMPKYSVYKSAQDTTSRNITPFTVMISDQVQNKLRTLNPTDAQSVQRALKKLQSLNTHRLLVSHAAQKVGKDSYLVRLGARKRLLFTEQDTARVVIDVGNSIDIIKAITGNATDSETNKMSGFVE